eukprot:4507865-Amphidinium_carterae.1
MTHPESTVRKQDIILLVPLQSCQNAEPTILCREHAKPQKNPLQEVILRLAVLTDYRWSKCAKKS